MAEYVWAGCEYVWIFNNRHSPGICILQYKVQVTLKVNECYTYWDIKYSELDERSKMERFGKIIIVLKYDKVLNICRNIIMEEFWIFQDSEKVRFLHMQELHKVLNMPKYGWNMPYERVLKMSGHCFTGL